MGERRARRSGRLGSAGLGAASTCTRSRAAAARLGRRLRRRPRAGAPGGDRRARRPQRARPRRLAARRRHRPAGPHRDDRRAQRLLEPSPRNRRGAASPSAWRPAWASPSGSTTWASRTTTTCSPRCGSRTSCSGCTERPGTRDCCRPRSSGSPGTEAPGCRRSDGDRPARAGQAWRRHRARPARSAARRSPGRCRRLGAPRARTRQGGARRQRDRRRPRPDAAAPAAAHRSRRADGRGRAAAASAIARRTRHERAPIDQLAAGSSSTTRRRVGTAPSRVA